MNWTSAPKRILETVLVPVALYYVARYRLARLLVSRDRAFELTSERLAVKPGAFGVLLRRVYYRRVLLRCGVGCTFSFGVILTKADVSLGDHVALGLGTIVSAAEFGSDIVVGPGVAFLSGRSQHGFATRDIPMSRQAGTIKKLPIGDDTWFGAAAVVMNDVGRGAIVAAGAVVVDPVPEFAIVGGNPAKVIAERP